MYRLIKRMCWGTESLEMSVFSQGCWLGWWFTLAGEQSREPGCRLRDGPVGSLRRGRGHELRVRVCRALPVLGLDRLGTAVYVLQEDFLSDGLLDAFTHSCGENNTHTHTEEKGRKLQQRWWQTHPASCNTVNLCHAFLSAGKKGMKHKYCT